MMNLQPGSCNPALVKESHTGVPSQKHMVASSYDTSHQEDEQPHILSDPHPIKDSQSFIHMQLQSDLLSQKCQYGYIQK